MVSKPNGRNHRPPSIRTDQGPNYNVFYTKTGFLARLQFILSGVANKSIVQELPVIGRKAKTLEERSLGTPNRMPA